MERENQNLSPLQRKIHEIIFEADTKAGKQFDIVLLISIVLSVLVVVKFHKVVYETLYNLVVLN